MAKRIKIVLLIGFFTIMHSINVLAHEYNVAKMGNDANDGSLNRPFKTIQAAANIARPGDTITVHQGIYRERVSPPRGGLSDTQRILYRAADGEDVQIKGSEIVSDWKRLDQFVWKLTLPNQFFGEYNPYIEMIEGDWFDDMGRKHHTGEVYLNEKSLWEVSSLEQVLKPAIQLEKFDPEGSLLTWYCESDEQNTTIYANFQGANPNKELVEINVRNSCFYPLIPGINYITVRGFRMSQAATNWAAPTAEQIGLIGTHWSKGWIIENNIISDSKCSGITLGKDRASGHNDWNKQKYKGGATIYNEVILRVQKSGWSKETVGSHIVRNNTIYNCEQTGICGSLGAIFSEISHNHIYNIWRKRLFAGAEIAGIKLHAPIDVVIAHNRIHDANKGMWMDWMTQGTRISSNLCYRNDFADLFLEVNHGPYLIDNNVFMSGIQNWSQGGIFVHNLIVGMVIINQVKDRFTPYFYPHSTELMGLGNIFCGDDQYYNNLFIQSDYNIYHKNRTGVGYGLAAYNSKEGLMQVHARNNIYINGAVPFENESNSMIMNGFNPQIKIKEVGNDVFLEGKMPDVIQMLSPFQVIAQSLKKSVTTHLTFENPDNSKLIIDEDYLGNSRNAQSHIGPFNQFIGGDFSLKIW